MWIVYNICVFVSENYVIVRLNIFGCRFYFKKVSDEFDCGVVFEEIRNDDDILPIFEEKIVGKVEKIDRNLGTWNAKKKKNVF